MEKQVFLVRVDRKQWDFKGKEKDWETIDVGDWVPFSPLFTPGLEKGDYIERKEHINRIKIKDIVIGYTCYEKKCIEVLGRMVSDQFNYIDGKAVLIQKTTQLKTPISRDAIKEIMESDPPLKANQPTITEVKEHSWHKIKEIILESNPEAAGDIMRLEEGRENWDSNSE